MRTRQSPLVLSALAVAAVIGAAGCEGTATGRLVTGPTGGPRVRLFNAVTSAPAIDFLVDGQVAASSITFGSASAYLPLSIGIHRMQVRSSTTGTTLLDVSRDLSNEGAFTLVPAPGLAQFGALFIIDDPTPVAGQARLRVVHAAAAPGAVSVYVTAPTVDLAAAVPVVPLLPFGVASAYVTLPPGTYRVRVTIAGNPGEVLLDTGGVTVGAGSVRSLVLTDAPGGGLPTSLSIVSDAN